MSAKLREALRRLTSTRPSNSGELKSDLFVELMELGIGDGPGAAKDRAVAIIGTAHLEEALRLAIEAHLLPMRTRDSDRLLFEDEAAPLAGLASRVRLAVSLGLVTEKERPDLVTIRGIRNAFAHSGDKITFETKEIREAVESLNLWKEMPGKDELAGISKGRVTTAGFAAVIAVYCGGLANRRDVWKLHQRQRQALADALLKTPATPDPLPPENQSDLKT